MTASPSRPRTSAIVLLSLALSCATVTPSVSVPAASPVTAPTPAAPPTPPVANADASPYPAAVQEYLRALAIDPARPDAWFNIGIYCLEHASDSIAHRRSGSDYLRRFIALAGHDDRSRAQVTRARRYTTMIWPGPTVLVAISDDASTPAPVPPPPPDPPCAPPVELLPPR